VGKTYGVDDDGREDSGGNRGSVFGIVLAADELGVVTLEEEAEDG
jgi:hypothetical protein